jgi:hypothetical protein
MSVCRYVGMYVCMNVCMHICTYVHDVHAPTYGRTFTRAHARTQACAGTTRCCRCRPSPRPTPPAPPRLRMHAQWSSATSGCLPCAPLTGPRRASASTVGAGGRTDGASVGNNPAAIRALWPQPIAWPRLGTRAPREIDANVCSCSCSEAYCPGKGVLRGGGPATLARTYASARCASGCHWLGARARACRGPHAARLNAAVQLQASAGRRTRVLVPRAAQGVCKRSSTLAQSPLAPRFRLGTASSPRRRAPCESGGVCSRRWRVRACGMRCTCWPRRMRRQRSAHPRAMRH